MFKIRNRKSLDICNEIQQVVSGETQRKEGVSWGLNNHWSPDRVNTREEPTRVGNRTKVDGRKSTMTILGI